MQAMFGDPTHTTETLLACRYNADTEKHEYVTRGKAFIYPITFSIQSKHCDGKNSPKTEVCILTLSSESRYHLDSILRFNEANILNNAMTSGLFEKHGVSLQESPNLDHSSGHDDYTQLFTLYNEQPPEIREDIVKQYDSLQKPQPVVLSGTLSAPSDNLQGEKEIMKRYLATPPYHPSCHGKMKVNIPARLVADKSAFTEFKSCNYVKLKLNADDQTSSIVNVKRDLFYLQKGCSSHWTASRLFEAFGDSVNKVRSLALSTKHPDFPQLLVSLNRYVNLELVLIIVGDASWDIPSGKYLTFWPRQWTKTLSGPEERISRPGEVMFEVLHPDNRFYNHIVLAKSTQLPASLMMFKGFVDFRMDNTSNLIIGEHTRD